MRRVRDRDLPEPFRAWIEMGRFVRVEKWSGGGTEGSDYLRIVTLDGSVDVADEHFTVDATEVNQAVSAARKSKEQRR